MTPDLLVRRRRTPIPNNLDAMRRALEAAGIAFANGDVPGVWMRKKRSG